MHVSIRRPYNPGAVLHHLLTGSRSAQSTSTNVCSDTDRLNDIVRKLTDQHEALEPDESTRYESFTPTYSWQALNGR